MIRRAAIKDIDPILCIVEEVKDMMHKYGNEQWNDFYPVYDDFYKDIRQGELFVDSVEEGGIRSFICLNLIQPPEYTAAEWSLERDALVIHRMAVNPRFQRMGLAKRLMSYADEKAVELGLAHIRSDTCSINTGMNSLFEHFGYRFTGTINFPSSKHDFNCYEKILQ